MFSFRSSKNNKVNPAGIDDLNDTKGGVFDDEIRPEDAIDEQILNQRVPRKPKKKTKKLPSYDTRQILSYGFRLDAPPNGEQAVGFMLLPDGTLAAVPIAPHMFLAKPKDPSPEPEEATDKIETIDGPKTPDNIENKPGPKTPEGSELEEGEVSESDNEDIVKDESDIEQHDPQVTKDVIDDEVDGVPFNILEDGYHTDEDKGSSSGSSVASSPPMPSPEVSDEEDPQTISERNVSTWQENYNTVENELDGEEMVENKSTEPSSSSSEEGELSDEDTKPVKTGMTGLASFLDKFSDNIEDANSQIQDKEDKSEYEQFYPPGYLEKSKEKEDNNLKGSTSRTLKPAYLMGSNIADDSLESSKNIYHPLHENELTKTNEFIKNEFHEVEKSPKSNVQQPSREFLNPPEQKCSSSNGTGPIEYRVRNQLHTSGNDQDYHERNQYFRQASQEIYSPEPYRSPIRYHSPPAHYKSPPHPQIHERFQSPEAEGMRQSQEMYDSHPMAWYQQSPPHQLSPPRNRMFLPSTRNIQEPFNPRNREHALLPPNRAQSPPLRNRQLSPTRNYQSSPPRNYQLPPTPRYRQFSPPSSQHMSPPRRQSPPHSGRPSPPHQDQRMSPLLRQQSSLSYQSRPPPPRPRGYYGQHRPYRPAPKQRPAYPPPRQPPVPRHQTLDLSNYTIRPLYIDKKDENDEDDEMFFDDYQPKNHFLGVSPRFIPLQEGGSGGITEQVTCLFAITQFILQCACSLCFFSVLVIRLKRKQKIDAFYPKVNGYISKIAHNHNISVYVVSKQNHDDGIPIPRSPAGSGQFVNPYQRQLQRPQRGVHVQPIQRPPFEDRVHGQDHHQLPDMERQTYYSEELAHDPRSYHHREANDHQHQPRHQEHQTYITEDEEPRQFSGESNTLTCSPELTSQSINSAMHHHSGSAESNPPQYSQQNKLTADHSNFEREYTASESGHWTSNSQIYYKDDSSDEENFYPPVQQYASSYITASHYPKPLDNNPAIDRSRKRTRTESSSCTSEDGMSHSSNDMSDNNRSSFHTSAPFSDLPAPKIKYSKDLPAHPFSDIPPPKMDHILPLKGIQSSMFKPFDETLFSKTQKFKSTLQECEQPKFSSFPKSIISMLKEEEGVTSIDKIIASYGGEIPLEKGEEVPSILQSIFGGESRLAPKYDEIDEQEQAKHEVERLRKQLHEEREKSKILEKKATTLSTSNKINPNNELPTKKKKKRKKGKQPQLQKQKQENKGQQKNAQPSKSQKIKVKENPVESNKQTNNPAPASANSTCRSSIPSKSVTSSAIASTSIDGASTSTSLSSSNLKTKVLDPEMEARRQMVLQKIAEFKKQNEQEKEELKKIIKPADRIFHVSEQKAPDSEILEKQREAAWKTAKQFALKKAVPSQTAIPNTKTIPSVTPAAPTISCNKGNVQTLTVSSLPAFYQAAIHSPSGNAPQNYQSMQQPMNYHAGINPQLGPNPIGMTQQGYFGMNSRLGYGNQYMGDYNTPNMMDSQPVLYSQRPNMPNNFNGYRYQQNVRPGPQIWPRPVRPRYPVRPIDESEDSQPPAPGTEPIIIPQVPSVRTVAPHVQRHVDPPQNHFSASFIQPTVSKVPVAATFTPVSTPQITPVMQNKNAGLWVKKSPVSVTTSKPISAPQNTHAMQNKNADLSAQKPPVPVTTSPVSPPRITAAMRNKNPDLWGCYPFVPKTSSAAITTVSSSVSDGKNTGISKMHKLQLASAQNIKPITVGTHSSIKPPAQPTVEFDHDKMRKAMQIKQKLDQSIKDFNKIKDKDKKPTKNRFDMTPNEVELQKMLSKPNTDEPQHDNSGSEVPNISETNKSIALDPDLDLDDIDNLVDHTTADLDLDF